MRGFEDLSGDFADVNIESTKCKVEKYIEATNIEKF